VTSIEVTEGNIYDSPQFVGLVERTAERFDIEVVSADKAYVSRANVNAVADVGGVAYIPFKSTNKARRQRALAERWHLFWYRRAELDRHHHQRSNVESSFSAMKRRFGGSIRSKKHQSQVNEILAKVLCYNLSVLVNEMFELGIEPEFWENSTGPCGK
jgi:transposase